MSTDVSHYRCDYCLKRKWKMGEELIADTEYLYYLFELPWVVQEIHFPAIYYQISPDMHFSAGIQFHLQQRYWWKLCQGQMNLPLWSGVTQRISHRRTEMSLPPLQQVVRQHKGIFCTSRSVPNPKPGPHKHQTHTNKMCLIYQAQKQAEGNSVEHVPLQRPNSPIKFNQAAPKCTHTHRYMSFKYARFFFHQDP